MHVSPLAHHLHPRGRGKWQTALFSQQSSHGLRSVSVTHPGKVFRSRHFLTGCRARFVCSAISFSRSARQAPAAQSAAEKVHSDNLQILSMQFSQHRFCAHFFLGTDSSVLLESRTVVRSMCSLPSYLSFTILYTCIGRIHRCVAVNAHSLRAQLVPAASQRINCLSAEKSISIDLLRGSKLHSPR